jgi:hypothetical protein
MRLSALTASLGPLQWLLSTNTPPQATRNQLHFELRHQYALSNSTRFIFTDIPKISSGDVTPYSVKTREITSYKPSYFVPYSRRPSRPLKLDQSENGDWDEVEILGPDVESREVLLELAKMTHNAYLEVDDSQWYDLGGNWTSVSHQSLLSTFHPSVNQIVHRHGTCSSHIIHRLLSDLLATRAISLGGNQMMTDFADMCSPHQTIPPSLFPSKVHPQASSAEVVLPDRRTDSTTICSLAVVVLE